MYSFKYRWFEMFKRKVIFYELMDVEERVTSEVGSGNVFLSMIPWARGQSDLKSPVDNVPIRRKSVINRGNSKHRGKKGFNVWETKQTVLPGLVKRDAVKRNMCWDEGRYEAPPSHSQQNWSHFTHCKKVFKGRHEIWYSVLDFFGCVWRISGREREDEEQRGGFRVIRCTGSEDGEMIGLWILLQIES